ncbi:MAG TPA: L,D-transpeptidase family protein [Actinomycetota bacterium]|nr:L,D-transpeptidase family protein [Actinomycetota bacterium]
MKRPLILLGLLTLLIKAADGSQRELPSSLITARAEAPVVVPLAAPIEVVDDEPPRQEPPTPTPEPSAAVDHTPRVGSRGPVVQELEQRLAGLGYMVGKVDGVFDSATRHGLIAFQKVEGLPRTGRGEPPVMQRLATATAPAPRYSSPANHLEVDIARQVVFVVRGGAVTAVLPTSTGSNKNFTSEGWTRRAITPNGQFKISRKINGMRISPLGELYKPSYFNGGIAFHGNGSVPTYPASHGCVRLPMPFADWFYANASPPGMVVYVYGGPGGSNPQPVIDDQPAPEVSPPADVAGEEPAPPAPPPDPVRQAEERREPDPTEPEEEEEDEDEESTAQPFPFDSDFMND